MGRDQRDERVFWAEQCWVRLHGRAEGNGLIGLLSSPSAQGNLLLTGDKDQLVMLLDQINSTFVRSNLSVLQGLLRIIPYLSFGEMEKMQILVDRFKPYCNFDK